MNLERQHVTSESAGLKSDYLSIDMTGKTRAKVLPKYRLMESNGKLHEWSGRGRKPGVFRDFEECGGDMDNLKI